MIIRSLGWVKSLFISVSIDFSRFIFISLDDLHVRKWSCGVEEWNKQLQYEHACLKGKIMFPVGERWCMNVRVVICLVDESFNKQDEWFCKSMSLKVVECQEYFLHKTSFSYIAFELIRILWSIWWCGYWLLMYITNFVDWI